MNSQDVKMMAIVVFRWLYFGLTILFLASMIFSFRILVSITSISLLASALIYHRLDQGKWWNTRFVNLFVVGCFLYFILQGVALIYTCNMKTGLFIQQTDLGIIALPVAVSYTNLINQVSYGKMMRWYVVILFSATVIALLHAFQIYIQTGSSVFFFYHPLVRIYSNHAIQFSILVVIAILFLIEESGDGVYMKSRRWVNFYWIYFSVILFLLTSKMVIILYFLYIIYLVVLTNKFFGDRRYRMAGLATILAILVFFLTTNSPLRRRIAEDSGSNIAFIGQSKFSPADYFTGIQFRLISWRFVYEVLNENHSWMKGVSPGDAQDFLNNKYRNLNMFTGGRPDNKKGYLGYHTHNQFLQALLETGIPGLVAFILLCAGMIQLAVKSASRPMIALTFLLLFYCFADAVLKTQYGIILFVWFPLFVYQGSSRLPMSIQSL
jgi:O-antigen ligase